MRRLFNKSPWFRRMLLMAALAPVAFIWGEGFTRILLPQSLDTTMNIFAPDPVVGFIYKANAKTYEKGREYNALYQINSIGLRDREYGPKKKGLFRVLLLGDSFSASHGLPLEQSLPRQLERALQKVFDEHGVTETIEIINAASGGYSPYNYWKAYQRWAPLFEPDAVLVAMSPDDYDCSNADAEYLIEKGVILAVFKKGQQPGRQSDVSIKTARKWLAQNSELYVLMRNFLYYNELIGQLSLRMNADGHAQAGQLQQYVVPEPEQITKAWEQSFTYLRSLRSAAEADHRAMIILSVPAKLEVDSKECERIITTAGLKPQEVDALQPQKVVNRFCSLEGIPFLDPRETLREQEALGACYFSYDDHWNAKGISVAAASIAQQWYELRLPPWPKPVQKKSRVQEVKLSAANR